MPSY
jgi:hypothetical protein